MFSIPVNWLLSPEEIAINDAEPLIVNSPLFGIVTPAIKFDNVLFPEPFKPTIPTISPSGTSKLTLFKA